jgi:Xaa-Pro dipeptidase
MDDQRIQKLRSALSNINVDAIVCGLPKNVLLLSGYWPAVGMSLAVLLMDGSIHLIVPEDENDLARPSGATLHTYKPACLDKLTTAAQAVREPLEALRAVLGQARIAIETGEESEPASYVSMHLFGDTLSESLKAVFPQATITAGGDLLKTLRATKTTSELAKIRIACAFARFGFESGAALLRDGLPEIMAAQIFRDRMKRTRIDCAEVQREEDFIWVMSGFNSAKAHGAYARSRTKSIENGDLVLVHCNSTVDGYWTDITRTYSLGRPDDKRWRMYEAILEARAAAFACIAPGRKAAEVDHAARGVLERHGFGKEFKHPTGHGIGFGAISPDALPRLHPKSPDVLETGMVFNIEPAIYFEGYGGIRHCDMVTVTEDGYELLTPFQAEIDDLILAA